jgi:DNA-binding CsgD family transcriptional regulator
MLETDQKSRFYRVFEPSTEEHVMAERVATTIPSFTTFTISVPASGSPEGQPSPAWARAALQMLSDREREVLALLAARWTDREIADALSISYRTVTTHVTHIFDKLGVNSRREAAAFVRVAGDDQVVA